MTPHWLPMALGGRIQCGPTASSPASIELERHPEYDRARYAAQILDQDRAVALSHAGCQAMAVRSES
jgi:hypothetical protein